MIKVGLKWEAGAQYIGRGSALGNPFAMKHEGERDARPIRPQEGAQPAQRGQRAGRDGAVGSLAAHA